MEAIRTPPSDAALNTTRLRLNRLLNLSGKGGRAAGHTLGVLGLFFSSAESLIGYFNDPAVPDAVNSVAAGSLLTLAADSCMTSTPQRMYEQGCNGRADMQAVQAAMHAVHYAFKF